MEICQFLPFQNEVFFAKNFADFAINWCKDCLMLLTFKFVSETIMYMIVVLQLLFANLPENSTILKLRKHSRLCIAIINTENLLLMWFFTENLKGQSQWHPTCQSLGPELMKNLMQSQCQYSRMFVCLFRSVGHFPSQLLLRRLHSEQLGSSAFIQCVFPRCSVLYGFISSLSCVHLSLRNRLQTTSKVLTVVYH